MESNLLIAVLSSITLILVLIIRFKIPAFIALLIASISAGLIAGMDPVSLMTTIKDGMGKSLGFIATVVGLGAIFGGILEHTGGAKTLAKWLLNLLGDKNTSTAMTVTGLLVAIPVFFDVGIIILYPVIAALQRQTGKSLIYYAVPLIGGLAVGHAFIPPTPGPLAIAEILNIPLGNMIIWGFIVGIPCAILGGMVYGKYLGGKLFIEAKSSVSSIEEIENYKKPGINLVLPILLFPVLLIVFSTVIDSGMITFENPKTKSILSMLTHPFSALLLANLIAWYVLGIKRGMTKEILADISTKSFYPIGVIILVTGAGGVFKEVLISTGIGDAIATSMQAAGIGIIAFAFITAMLVRILQGSATVAMITAGGLVAPLLVHYTLSSSQLALVGVAVASGATSFSHLNDSGFWMVKEVFGLTEPQAIRTWTVASTIIGFVGFGICLMLFYIL
jgi:Gnt-I system low-affinity gluconate transporter